MQIRIRTFSTVGSVASFVILFLALAIAITPFVWIGEFTSSTVLKAALFGTLSAFPATAAIYLLIGYFGFTFQGKELTRMHLVVSRGCFAFGTLLTLGNLIGEALKETPMKSNLDFFTSLGTTLIFGYAFGLHLKQSKEKAYQGAAHNVRKRTP